MGGHLPRPDGLREREGVAGTHTSDPQTSMLEHQCLLHNIVWKEFGVLFSKIFLKWCHHICAQTNLNHFQLFVTFLSTSIALRGTNVWRRHAHNTISFLMCLTVPLWAWLVPGIMWNDVCDTMYNCYLFKHGDKGISRKFGERPELLGISSIASSVLH